MWTLPGPCVDVRTSNYSSCVRLEPHGIFFFLPFVGLDSFPWSGREGSSTVQLFRVTSNFKITTTRIRLKLKLPISLPRCNRGFSASAGVQQNLNLKLNEVIPSHGREKPLRVRHPPRRQPSCHPRGSA